jgi:hypothetical protein
LISTKLIGRWLVAGRSTLVRCSKNRQDEIAPLESRDRQQSRSNPRHTGLESEKLIRGVGATANGNVVSAIRKQSAH